MLRLLRESWVTLERGFQTIATWKRNGKVVKSFFLISEGSAAIMLFPFPSFLTVHLTYTLPK